MKENYKNAPQTLTGQRGEYQKNGKSNNTLNKAGSTLDWIYEQGIRGQNEK